MGGVALLTGSTGFLGTEVARTLLRRSEVRIVALVLASDDQEARLTAERAWSYAPDLEQALAAGLVEVVAGDVRRAGLGLDPHVRDDLISRVTHIIHAAADLRIDTAPDDLRPTNVEGVANILAFARACHADHGLAHLSHVSTAYVAGGRTGEAAEEALDDRFGFENAYELTKFEGERLVRAAMDQLPISVFRPAMIVGDSRTGEVRTFNTFYVPLRRYLTGQVRVAPTSRRQRVNIVPVDHVAEAIVHLTFEPAAAGLTFHLAAPTAELPTAVELMRFVRTWACERLGVRLPQVVFVPVPRLRRTAAAATELERRGHPRSGSGVAALRPYLRETRRFRRDNSERMLGPYALPWRSYMPVLLEHAVNRGFLHRSDRTVHEQALFRLGSRSLAVRYLDVLGDRIEARSGPELRDDVLAAAAALRSMGINPGARIAMIGPNSTRYLTVDLAIGLVGAVSVPMYPTSPNEDIEHIVRASGAELLFAGSTDITKRLGPVASGLRCVSFARSSDGIAGPVEGWDAFLRRGRGAPPVPRSPVSFDAVATLRYTSGTTGPPKGVAFTHRQLRWMAETMASLVPWATRSRPGSYLSFLPMNHVVEGILGTYSPYYMPVPVEIAFLENFANLPRALRAVRPMVFFAVPRIYEKFLDVARSSRTGQRFLAMPEGVRKRLLRPFVRRRLLRRAGLDRCSQLMVGSAPVGEPLLRAFRDLGIEIYDAYGLTEAPLVTLNRSGHNRIGTAGELLPETHVRIADDGEILVRGPQVMVGYADEGTVQPFEDGWLLTGDLGHLTDDGALVIDGRKKELLKTAYGKYLNPAKVESMLRAIPDVTEAMVVGEGRPFCTALVWADGALTPERVSAIDAAIERVNLELSRPERVRRWAIHEYDLSVAGGELTPNLKLKRARIAERYGSTIASLYAAGEAPARTKVAQP
ncbi:MAG TPA: AMP-binding protein [Jiangellaceae bacterium]|nr:AMP-binding protein [Jiangellaceae bacterium]